MIGAALIILILIVSAKWFISTICQVAETITPDEKMNKTQL